MIRLWVLIATLLFLTAPVYATTARWDAGTDSSIQGYRLYRAEGSCMNPMYFVPIQTYGVVTSGAVTDPASGGIASPMCVSGKWL